MFCLKFQSLLSLSTSRLICCLAIGTASLFTLGCGQGPEAEFQFRASTSDLIPDAQRAVKKTLKDAFGTPQSLVAWERFPVSYGGGKGSVTSAGQGTVADVAFEGDTAGVVKDAPLLWITGARAVEGHNVDAVTSYDAATKKLKWSGATEPIPGAGDKFIVGFGKGLQVGRVAYMRNCMHCHGVSGDGNGPTAQYLNPLPRDYRDGTFKFKSTLTAEKPTRDDLTRVIKYGIPGTYMPSFLWLGETETVAVVEYVRWLSMRGELEKRIDNDLGEFSMSALEANQKKAEAEWASKPAGERGDRPTLSKAKKAAAEEFAKLEKEELAERIDEASGIVANAWKHCEEAESLVVPSVARVSDDAASRERGRKIYLSDRGKCYTCHGVQARGDGPSTEDFWPKPGSTEKYTQRGLHDDWGNPLMPRNLTLGQYRGGRRPVDIFRKIYAGIKGGPMPGFGKTALKDDEIWDVVNYVMSLPYEAGATKVKVADTVAITH